MTVINKYKSVILLSISFLLVSCKNEKKTYYDDRSVKLIENYNSDNKRHGKSIEFYPNGIVKETKNYKNGFLIDSVTRYNDKGKLDVSIQVTKDSLIHYLKVFDSLEIVKAKGFIKNKNKIGDWRYFNGSKLVGEDEFLEISNNKIKLNQQKKIINGKIDDSKSFYFNLNLIDTLEIDHPYSFEVEYNFIPSDLVYRENKFIYLCVSNKIDKSFSNLNEVEIDTFIPKKDGLIEGRFLFNKLGKNFIRGTIEEHNLIEEEDSVRIEISKMYFEKEVFIQSAKTKINKVM